MCCCFSHNYTVHEMLLIQIECCWSVVFFSPRTFPLRTQVTSPKVDMVNRPHCSPIKSLGSYEKTWHSSHVVTNCLCHAYTHCPKPHHKQTEACSKGMCPHHYHRPHCNLCCFAESELPSFPHKPGQPIPNSYSRKLELNTVEFNSNVTQTQTQLWWWF